MSEIVKKETGAIVQPNPGVTWTWLTSLLVALFAPLVPILSKAIREELIKMLKALQVKAHETPNPWDDWVIGFFLTVLGE
jgi:hypothetical protein